MVFGKELEVIGRGDGRGILSIQTWKNNPCWSPILLHRGLAYFSTSCLHPPKERSLARNIKMWDVSWYSLPIAHNWKMCSTCPSHRTLKRTTLNGNTSSHVNSLFFIMHGDFRLLLTYPVSNISISYFNMVAIHSFTLLNIVSFASSDHLLSLF